MSCRVSEATPTVWTKRIAAVAALLALACGDNGVVDPDLKIDDEVIVTIAIDGPDTVSFSAIMDSITLSATVTVSSGSLPGVTWESTRFTVAQIDQSGTVTAVGNGEGLIIARAGSVSDTVTVITEQVSANLGFYRLPVLAAANTPFLPPIVVAVLDANRQVIESSVDTLSVRLAAGPGGSLAGSLTAVPDTGFAMFDSLVIDQPGTGYVLEVLAAFDTITSNSIEVLTGPDLVRFHNLDGHQLGALFDGDIRKYVEDLGIVQADSTMTVIFEPSSVHNEIIAFTKGRPPVVNPAPGWTTSPDTIDVTFGDPLRIAVTAWIIRGPFESLRDRAIDQALTTSEVWFEERMGVEFAEFEIVDATGDPDAPALYHTTTCAFEGQAETTIGKRSGRINIYYVETVDGGHGRGYSCGTGGGIFMADASGHELLVHELGHSFGLGHVDGDPLYTQINVMHSASSVRRYLTEGQVFRSLYDNFTALNQIYGVVTSNSRFCADGFVASDCPWLGLRLWTDGLGQTPNYRRYP